MIRLLPLLLLSLSLFACSKSGELATIEDAEAYAKARGVALVDKKEDTQQAVATRSYHYQVGEVRVGLLQFASSEGAASWKKLLDDSPLLGGGVRIHKGPVAIMIWGATDTERQKVVEALK